MSSSQQRHESGRATHTAGVLYMGPVRGPCLCGRGKEDIGSAKKLAVPVTLSWSGDG